MINFIDLYKNMENPLTNELINEIVKTSTTSLTIGNFLTTKKSSISNLSNTYFDNLYKELFHILKRSISNLSDKEIDSLINYKIVDSDYLKLKEILEITPYIKSKNEYDELLKKEPLIKKYGINSIKNNLDWVFINSYSLNGYKDIETSPIEHALYIDCDHEAIGDIILFYINECKIRFLPFYIKYNTNGNRKDSIIFYSSTKNLLDNIQILKKTHVYNKELFSKHVNTAPLLTGKIENWLGYTSHPSSLKNHSYFDEISNLFMFALDKSLVKWIYDNKNIKINSNYPDDYLYLYLSRALSSVVIKRYIKEFNESKNEEKTAQRLGITLEELKSKEFKEKVSKILQWKMFSIISSRYEKTPFPNISIPTSNNKNLTVFFFDMINAERKSAYQIYKNCPSFAEEFKNQTMHLAESKDIDMNKFCFKNKIRENLFYYQKRVLSKKK